MINEEVRRRSGADDAFLERARARELAELERRRARYLGDRGQVDPAGHTAIIVDDGLATGATMKAALIAMKRQGAAKVCVAVPVAPEEALKEIGEQADLVVCLHPAKHFYGVGALLRRLPPADRRGDRRAAAPELGGEPGHSPERTSRPCQTPGCGAAARPGRRSLRSGRPARRHPVRAWQRIEPAQSAQRRRRGHAQRPRLRHASARSADAGRSARPPQCLRHSAACGTRDRGGALDQRRAGHRRPAARPLRRQHRRRRGPARCRRTQAIASPRWSRAAAPGSGRAAAGRGRGAHAADRRRRRPPRHRAEPAGPGGAHLREAAEDRARCRPSLRGARHARNRHRDGLRLVPALSGTGRARVRHDRAAAPRQPAPPVSIVAALRDRRRAAAGHR